jgi:PKHD-type hydroxylase
VAVEEVAVVVLATDNPAAVLQPSPADRDKQQTGAAAVLTVIPDVLTEEELAAVLDLVGSGPEFADGSDTAGYRAQRGKKLEQLRGDDEVNRQIARIVLDALDRNETFNRVAMPRQALAPFVSRCRPGMEHGLHFDNAFSGGLHRLRKDIALTLFLSDPASYDGGELTITTGWGGERAYKPAQSSAVVYPADRLHRVSKVTRGERLVAVTWIESYVRDPAKREIILDMLCVAEHLHGIDPDAPQTELAYKCHANLMRRWADT